jgi:DNA-binding response OmpR family regulator
MKKILVADAIKPFIENEKYLLRSDVKLLTATTNDEILSVHRSEKVNLIIAQLDIPGVNPERVYAEIRKDADLRNVSLIMICHDNPADKTRAERCSPNAILPLPINSRLLLEKARHFLNITSRESYRVLLSVNLDGRSKDHAFFCRSENISTTGLLLETGRSLQEGDRVTCSFFLPDSKKITVPAEIVRKMIQSDQSGVTRYGVKFEKMDFETRSAIESFVQKKAQRSPR